MFRCDYNVYSTFQSHEPEFDYLKSLEIEEKINQICWVKQSGSSLFLLTTNGKVAFIVTCCNVCGSLCFRQNNKTMEDHGKVSKVPESQYSDR